MDLTTIAILSLSVWRISSLLVYERGPFDMFEKLRKKAGVSHDDNHEPSGWDDGRYFAVMLSCIWCTSLVVSFAVAILFFILKDIAIVLLFPFFLGAVVIGYERFVNG